MINARRADVVWSYIGTFMSMFSGFLLLPLLMRFLGADELGLWYVYVAIANLAVLFEFGFNPTFARNIVYVVSGARRLTAKGCDSSSIRPGIDWHLLRIVITASKSIYALLSAVVMALLLIVGTPYISFITSGIENKAMVWVSWALFVTSMVTNLYFLYSITILRGYGDIAGENMAKTFAKVAQLIISAVLLIMGFGLIGAAVGYLVNSLLLRIFGIIRIHGHREIEVGLKASSAKVTVNEIIETVKTISHVAWRDGVVNLSSYASSQGMSILSSLFLGLAETGTYSILLQLTTAIYNFACAYPKSFLPAMQSAFANDDLGKQREIVASGSVAYCVVYLISTVGVLFVVLPILPLFKPGIDIDPILFMGLAFYMFLLQQHSIFCCYIISMNEIPYMASYLVASLLGLLFVSIFCGTFGLGAWGIVGGQFLSQLIYNNWYWPRYLCKKIGMSYWSVLRYGAKWWKTKISRIVKLNRG